MRWLRSFLMPGAVLGGFLCPLASHSSLWIQGILVVLLFLGFLRIHRQDVLDIRQHWKERYQAFGLRICFFWLFASVGWAAWLWWKGSVQWQAWDLGVLLILLAPTATASPVSAQQLGFRIPWVFLGVLGSHLTAILWIPLLLGGLQANVSWSGTLALAAEMVRSIALMILLPLILALLVRKAHWRMEVSPWISLLLWAVAIYLVVSRTSVRIHSVEHWQTLWGIGVASLSVMLLQFGLGYALGGKAFRGEGAIVLGQRNTILAIWLAQTYTESWQPLAVFGPLFYVIWQNSLLAVWMGWKTSRT